MPRIKLLSVIEILEYKRPGPGFQAQFSSLRTCNSRLQYTVKYLLRDTVIITQNVILSNVYECKIQKRNKILIWIKANRHFRNRAQTDKITVFFKIVLNNKNNKIECIKVSDEVPRIKLLSVIEILEHKRPD